jgi:polyvinyl alcohol dehydrogenase (cytochrome)
MLLLKHQFALENNASNIRAPHQTKKGDEMRTINAFQHLTAILFLLTSLVCTEGAFAASVGEATFKTRCAVCHDAGLEQAPGTNVLIGLPHSYIVNALTNGPMKPMAAGLSADDIASIATYLTERKKKSKGVSLPAPDVDANMCSKPGPEFKIAATDWNGFSPTPDNARFQKNTQINASNVANLKPKWVFAYPGGGVLGAPSSVGGRVFIGTRIGIVFALDAETGCTYWHSKPGGSVKTPIVVGEIKSATVGARTQFIAYYGSSQGVVYAVDAETGNQLWKVKPDEHRLAAISGALTLVDNKLYVPIMTSVEGGAASNGTYGCCTLRGSLIALDATTGEKLWQGYTINETPKPFRLNSDGTQMYGPAGASVWSPATLDLIKGVSYVTTGQSRTDVPEDGSDAVLAMKLGSGQRLWGRQFTANDAWMPGCNGEKPGPNCPKVLGPDTDFGSPAILQPLANGKRILIGAQKSGAVHGLDPDDNGKSIWQTDLSIDAELPKGRILRDRENAGVVFGMASDGQKVYVAIADPTKTKGHIPSGVYALDIATGKIVWRAPGQALPSCSWGAVGCAGAQRTAVTIVDGVVFAGSANGHMFAYDVKTGAVLWDYDTAKTFDAVNGVPAQGGAVEGVTTAITADSLYLMSGYGSYGGGVGNALIAFSLK